MEFFSDYLTHILFRNGIIHLKILWRNIFCSQIMGLSIWGYFDGTYFRLSNTYYISWFKLYIVGLSTKKTLFPHVGHVPWLFRTTWGRVVRPLSHWSAGRNSSAIAGGRERARALKQCWRGTLSVTGTGGPGIENHGKIMDTYRLLVIL